VKSLQSVLAVVTRAARASPVAARDECRDENSLALEHLVEYGLAMPRKSRPGSQGDMLQGTLDLLILKSLALGPAHGHTIAYAIERGSDHVLQVEHGSLYPALYRLEDRGLISASWGTSDNNRKAKFYRLTAAGKKQLALEETRWELLVRAIGRILKPAAE
jgi:PadR family transcriptional regulator, regulatory protein PadR